MTVPGLPEPLGGVYLPAIRAALVRARSLDCGREALEARLREVAREYEGRDVPRPPFWGGYRLRPVAVEFWQGRPNRFHDRLRYRRLPSAGWQIERLAP